MSTTNPNPSQPSSTTPNMGPSPNRGPSPSIPLRKKSSLPSLQNPVTSFVLSEEPSFSQAYMSYVRQGQGVVDREAEFRPESHHLYQESWPPIQPPRAHSLYLNKGMGASADDLGDGRNRSRGGGGASGGGNTGVAGEVFEGMYEHETLVDKLERMFSGKGNNIQQGLDRSKEDSAKKSNNQRDKGKDKDKDKKELDQRLVSLRELVPELIPVLSPESNATTIKSPPKTRPQLLESLSNLAAVPQIDLSRLQNVERSVHGAMVVEDKPQLPALKQQQQPQNQTQAQAQAQPPKLVPEVQDSFQSKKDQSKEEIRHHHHLQAQAQQQQSHHVRIDGHQDKGEQEKQGDPSSSPSPLKSLAILFKIHKELPYGQVVGVVGNLPGLGKWKAKHCLVLKWHDGDEWKSTLEIDLANQPVYSRLEYKYITYPLGDLEQVVWEPGVNRLILLDDHIQPELHVHDSWGKGVGSMSFSRMQTPRVSIYGNPGSNASSGASSTTSMGAPSTLATAVPVSAKSVLESPSNVGPAGPGTITPRMASKASGFTLQPKATSSLLHMSATSPSPRVVTALNNPDRVRPFTRETSGNLLNTLHGQVTGRVRFSVNFETQYGDNVFVCGSLPELGNWNKQKARRMKFVKGSKDRWQLDLPLPSSIVQFEYKYFLWKADGERQWEIGYSTNRICMPWLESALKIIDNEPTALMDDRWEMNRVVLSIYFPTKADECMYITGDPEALGGWFKPGPIRMNLGEVELLETDVEGQKWVLDIYLPFSIRKFDYRYVLMNEATHQAVWEREPNRKADLDSMGVALNGTYMLKDVNFVAGMEFDYVPDNMFVGPFPQNKEDLQKLKDAGVTAVINLQTDEDFRHRHVDWPTMESLYKEVGILIVRKPITDFDRESLRHGLKDACRRLDELIKNGHNVFIHCTAGMGRAPALAVSYLVFYKHWQLQHAVDHVKHHRKVAAPNVPLIQELINSG